MGRDDKQIEQDMAKAFEAMPAEARLFSNHMLVHIDACPVCRDKFAAIAAHVTENFAKDDEYFCHGEMPKY